MAIRIGTEIPSFEGATEWLNGSAAEALAEAKGHPTLVHFWSLSCGICKENLPRIVEWRAAAEQYSIVEPCAIDNEHKLRDAFQNDHGYVPAYYLFDKNGKLRGFAAGERGLSLIAPTIERVLTGAANKAA